LGRRGVDGEFNALSARPRGREGDRGPKDGGGGVGRYRCVRGFRSGRGHLWPWQSSGSAGRLEVLLLLSRAVWNYRWHSHVLHRSSPKPEAWRKVNIVGNDPCWIG